MPTQVDTKKRALHRIRIIQGHLAAVGKMIKEEKYCVDILHQSQAVQRALVELDALLLERHLSSCVARSIRNGKASRSIKELLEIYRTSRH